MLQLVVVHLYDPRLWMLEDWKPWPLHRHPNQLSQFFGGRGTQYGSPERQHGELTSQYVKEKQKGKNNDRNSSFVWHQKRARKLESLKNLRLKTIF